MNTRVMVSGVGGIIGYGVLRALREGHPSLPLVGTDVFDTAVGQHWADTFVPAPFAASEEWEGWLMRTMRERGVDIFIPTLDPELDRFAADPNLEARLPAKVALPGNKMLAVAQDKLLLHQYLGDDAANIATRPAGDYLAMREALGSPFLVKPRSGYGSRGIRTIHNESDYLAALGGGRQESFIAQEIVGTEDEEYTVGVFGDGQGSAVAKIVLKRWLSAEGATARALTVCASPSMEAAIGRITQGLAPVGPFNLQFRMHEGEARLLEINARMSSTTSMRAAFGYNEPKMLIDYLVSGELPRQPQIRGGYATRYVEDLVHLK